MDYINEYNVFMYNQSRAMQQHSLESYISECMILAEGTNIVPRIRALHEADNEKTIGGFFKKIWEFIKRIWAKFIDKMTRLMAGNKRWLDKNRAIILNNAFKYDSITIYNYPEGVKRMVNGAVPAFNYADIEKELDTDAKAYEFVAKKIGYNGYKYNEDDDNSFSQDMKEWFFGGAEQIEIPKAKVNLTDMFNYCYEYDKMKEAIQKDKTNLERTIENMNRIVVSKAAKTTADNDKANKADDGNATANGGTNNDTNNPQPDPNGTSPAAQQAAAAAGTTTAANNGNAQPTNSQSGGQTTQNASFIFSNVYNTYISEADKAEVNGDPDNDANKDTVVRKRSAGTGRYGSKDATAKANMSNVSGKSDSDDENNKNIANAASGEEAVEIQKRCTRYNNAASGVLAAKLSAAEQCYKDYMRIMIAHVDSYTGRRQTNDKMATAATDFSNGNNNNNQQAAQGQQQQDNGGAQQQQPAQNTGNNQQAAPAQGQQQTQQQGNK